MIFTWPPGGNRTSALSLAPRAFLRDGAAHACSLEQTGTTHSRDVPFRFHSAVHQHDRALGNRSADHVHRLRDLVLAVDQPDQADQQPKQDLVTGEHDQQSDFQSAIVLINRRIKAEREVITFVPVCSRVAGMHCIIPKDRRAIKRERVYISTREPSERKTYAPMLPKRSAQEQRSVDCYCGAGDGVGEAASVAGDGVGAVVSTVEDGAAGAGNTAPLNIFDLCCFWVCEPFRRRCL